MVSNKQNFFRELGDDAKHQIDVDVDIFNNDTLAHVTSELPGRPEDILLVMDEEQIDGLRNLLFEVSRQLMFNRNSRAQLPPKAV